MLRRLTLLVILIPAFLLVACSDDDSDAPSTGASTSVTQTEASVTETQSTASAVTTRSGTAAGVVEGSIAVDFTGSPEEQEKLEASFSVEAGTTAWDAIKAALGEDNLAFQDFGGDLGIFITGFKGVEAEGNHFWEFRVNGETAEAGISKYVVQPGDVLEFVYSSF